MSPTFVNDLFRLCGKSTHDIISPLNEWNMPWAPSVFNLMGFVFAVTFIVLVVLFGHPPDWPNLPAMGMTKVADTVQTLSILEPAASGPFAEVPAMQSRRLGVRSPDQADTRR
jgi:hypothetical protein